MSILEVVILSRNRPKYLIESVHSILAQRSAFIGKIIISDNSSNDHIATLAATLWPRIEVRRYNNISAEQHFKSVIDRSSLEYLMMFHDDDILMPTAIDKLMRAALNNQYLSAVACNGRIAYDKQVTDRTMIRYAKADLLISSHQQLIQRYLDYWKGGVAPLSSYIYRRSILKADYVDTTTAGKYSDVSMLLQTLSHGPIMWINEPLSIYRIHPQSDNSDFSLKDKLKLLAYLSLIYKIDRRSYLSLNAKSEYYQLAYNIQPSLSAFLCLSDSSRMKILHRFITRLALARFLRSNRYRLHLLLRLAVFIASPFRRSS